MAEQGSMSVMAWFQQSFGCAYPSGSRIGEASKPNVCTSEVRAHFGLRPVPEVSMPASWFARSLQTLRLLKTTAVSLIFCILAHAAFAQTFTVLYSFTGGADGADPAEGLILDSAGNLYGSANYGGTGSCDTDGLHGCGVVFKVTKDGAETVLHTFEGGSDGSYPWGGLTLDKDGNLYGT